MNEKREEPPCSAEGLSEPRRGLSNRRTFVKHAIGAASAMSIATGVAGGSSRPVAGRKLRVVGWQVGITYQSGKPQGVDRDYLLRLLDEMTTHRMNLLSLMMLSYGFYDPEHDGYAWPVRNPALRHYQDADCLNGHTDTEFVREIIQAAEDRQIEVQLFLNWGIWNPEKIHLGYPAASVQVSREGESAGWLHCPDAPGSWQAGLDEAKDLLEFYAHRNVKSLAFERISYQSANYCYCPCTREQFYADTGGDMFAAKKSDIDAWKNGRVGRLIAEYVRHIRGLRPDLSIGLHTQCAQGWGHDPALLKSYGIDMVLPHTIQFRESKDSLHALLRRLEPNPCVLHFCTRDRRPANYNLWVKTPEIIEEALTWIRHYPGGNLAGLLFFNEPATSPANKKAVYRSLRHFEW